MSAVFDSNTDFLMVGIEMDIERVVDNAEQALEQIDDRGYAIPYQADGRRVVKVGVKFNPDTRVPEEWSVR